MCMPAAYLVVALVPDACATGAWWACSRCSQCLALVLRRLLPGLQACRRRHRQRLYCGRRPGGCASTAIRLAARYMWHAMILSRYSQAAGGLAPKVAKVGPAFRRAISPPSAPQCALRNILKRFAVRQRAGAGRSRAADGVVIWSLGQGCSGTQLGLERRLAEEMGQQWIPGLPVC